MIKKRERATNLLNIECEHHHYNNIPLCAYVVHDEIFLVQMKSGQMQQDKAIIDV
jgi:hypothetical protein